MGSEFLEDSDVDMVADTPNLGASVEIVPETMDKGEYEEGEVSMHLD